MKKLFLSLLALVVLGIGAYVWANRISGDELPELLTGEYELLRWELVSNGEQPDSLMLRHLPKVGDRVHLTYLSESELSITTQSDKLLLRSACCDALKGYKLRSGEIIQIEDITIKEHFPETEDESTIEKWATVTAAVCARVMQSDIDEHSKMYSIARLENVVFSVSYKEEEFVVNIEVCC